MKFAFIDLETTGVDEKTHSPYQIACVITNGDLEEIDSINLTFQPKRGCLLDPEAMKVTGMTREKFESLEVTYEEAYKILILFLEKHVNRYDKKDKLQFVAYNSQFDDKFIRRFFEDNGDPYFGSWFWYPYIDVMQQAAWLTRNVREQYGNFQLQSVCKMAEIVFDEDEAHDALYDVRKTLELYKYFND